MDGKEMTRKDDGSMKQTRGIPSFRQVTPLVDIYENDDEILLHAEMPGVRKEDVSVHIDNGNLTLSGVRSLAQNGVADWEELGNIEYQRVFSVPQSIDVITVHAKLKDGVLALHLPKSEAAKPKQIKINAG